MVLLDTNVVSEVIKPNPDAVVARWFSEQPVASLFMCAVTEAELRLGVAIMPEGRRRDALAALIEGVVSEDYVGRNLPFDSRAAMAYATLSAARRRAGRPISTADAQIAAIAKSQGSAVATRNIADFEGCGITLIDPWSAV